MASQKPKLNVVELAKHRLNFFDGKELGGMLSHRRLTQPKTIWRSTAVGEHGITHPLGMLTRLPA